MGKKLAILSLLTALFATLPAYAHDESLHHGAPVMGEVTAVNSGGFFIKNDGGVIQVKLLPDTKIEAGMKGEPGTLDALKVGAHTMVYGTKLETGELVAKEVMIHQMNPPRQAAPSKSMPMGNMNHDMSGRSMHGSH